MQDDAYIIDFAADIANRVLIEDEDLAIRVAAAQDSAEEVTARFFRGRQRLHGPCL